MKTIKINNLEIELTLPVLTEITRIIKENPELLQEEKKPFAERMIGKEYWFIFKDGEKGSQTWDNASFDNTCLSVNNVFFTESDCDKEIARRKALGNIMSYIRDNEIELVKDEDYSNEDIIKYCIGGWDYSADEVCVDYWIFNDDSVFNQNFYSQEDREKVISNCAKDLEILLKK